MLFVTGGSGLVGSHLILELLRSGQEVRALCRPGSDLRAVKELFTWYSSEAALLYDRVQWVTADLNDLPFLESVFNGVTAVYHCAALISFDPGDEERLLKVNQEGTRNIVNLCLDKGISRLYYTSSIATVGGRSGTLTENDLWDPSFTNVYATSKYLAEMEVWRGAQEGLETVIVNPGVILGPGFWKKGSGKFFSRIASGVQYALPGGTGFVGVWDVIRAITALGEAGAINERFILVGTNLEYFKLMKQVADLLNKPSPGSCLSAWQLEALWRIDWIRSKTGGGRRRLSKDIVRSIQLPITYSSDKIKERLGFEFQPLDEVLKQCISNYTYSQKMLQS